MRLFLLLVFSCFAWCVQAQSAYHGGISDGYSSINNQIKVDVNGGIQVVNKQNPKAIYLSKNQELPSFVSVPLSLTSLQGAVIMTDFKSGKSIFENTATGMYFLKFKDEEGSINTLIINIL